MKIEDLLCFELRVCTLCVSQVTPRDIVKMDQICSSKEFIAFLCVCRQKQVQGKLPDISSAYASKPVLRFLILFCVPFCPSLRYPNAEVNPATIPTSCRGEVPQLYLLTITCLLLSSPRPIIMQAVVFKGPLQVALEERPVPQIQDPTDVILKVRYTALCGR